MPDIESGEIAPQALRHAGIEKHPHRASRHGRVNIPRQSRGL
jgi:hypothetical protein